MTRNAKGPRGAKPSGPFNFDLLPRDRVEAKPTKRNYQLACQYRAAAVRNARMGAKIGGRAGRTLIWLGAIFARRAEAIGGVDGR